MSFLLSQWIQKDVGLEPKFNPQEMESVFKTGYMFGKLLDTLGIQEHFGQYFVTGDSVDAIIKNYTSLEATLRQKLKIRLSSTAALDLIHGKAGSVAKLLYEIKRAVDSIPYESWKKDGVSTNTSMIRYTQETLSYDKQAIEHFATILKSKLKRTNQFVSKYKHQEPIIKKKELPPIPKVSPKQKSNLVKESVSSCEKPGNMLPRESEVQNTISKINPAMIQTLSEMNQFESKLNQEFHSMNQDDQNPLEIKTFLQQRALMDSSVHVQELTKRMEQSNCFDEKQTELYLEKIRLTRWETEAARKDREKRRKQILLLHQKVQKELEKKAVQELMDSKLSRQSKQERRIAEQLMQIRHEKEVMYQNRVYREEQYVAYRQKEYEEALEREHQLYVHAQQEYRHQVGLQMKQHLELLEKKQKLKHEKNQSFCQLITNQILQLVFQYVDYQTIHDGKQVPMKKVQEWKLLLLNDLEIQEVHVPIEKEYIPLVSDDPVDDGTLQEKQEFPESVKVLDKSDLDDYLHYRGQWNISPSEPILDNEPFHQLIQGLFQMTLPPIDPYSFTPLPTVPLRIAMIGKKCSGKQTTCQLIAQKFQMTMLHIDDLVRDAIRQADIMKKKEKEGGKKTVSRQQIGAKLQLAMMEGQTPDDSLLVSLVLEAMSGESEPGGFLLIDFPKTKQQAQLLEREMSGYEDPKPIKKGDLKRSKDKERVPTGHRNRSLLHSTDNGMDSHLNPISGFDAIFLLDVSNENAIKRATGQWMDPLTNEIYHIENNPPPSTIPGTMDRLTPVQDSSRALSQLQYHLTQFQEEQVHLMEWLSTFKIVHVIDANDTIEKTQSRVIHELHDVIVSMNKNQKEIQGDGIVGFDSNSPRNSVTRPATGNPSAMGNPITTGNPSAMGNTTPPVPMTTTTTTTTHTEKKPLLPFAHILINQWKSIESTYTDQLQFIFRCLRRFHHDSLLYFYSTKTRFYDYVQRMDHEQTILETFLQEYHLLEDDFKSDVEVKQELHSRVEQVRDILWDMSDKKRDESENERISIIEDKWVEDQSIMIVNMMIIMLQAELDYYISSRQLIIDYYHDSKGNMLMDVIKQPIRIPFLSPIQNQSPIELASHLISIHEQEMNQRRDVLAQKLVLQQPMVPTINKKEKEKTKKNQEPVPVPLKPLMEKEMSHVFDIQETFSDIQTSIDFINHTLESNEYSLESLIEKDVGGQVMVPEYYDMIQKQEQILIQRVNRIKDYFIQKCNQLKMNCTRLFLQLDEWIGIRYQNEMDAIKDVTMILKECIEMEQKCSNRILLEPKGIVIDYGTLVVPPKQTSVPEYPIESKNIEHFTITQLIEIVLQLIKISPLDGFLTTTTMSDYLYTMISFHQEFVPECWIHMEATQIQQMIQLMDPLETGFVPWKKFIMIQTRLFPISFSVLQKQKQDFLVGFKELYSHEQVPVTGTRFDGSMKSSTTTTIDRPTTIDGSMKSSTTGTIDRPTTIDGSLILDGIPSPETTTFTTTTTCSSTPISSNNEKNTNTSSSNEKNIDIHHVSFTRNEFLQQQMWFEDHPEAHKLKQLLFELFQKQQRLHVKELLLYCALDDNPLQGVEKAFMVTSHESVCTRNDIQDMYHLFLKRVSCSHRTQVQDLLRSRMDWNEFQRVIQPEWFQLYGIEVFQ